MRVQKSTPLRLTGRFRSVQGKKEEIPISSELMRPPHFSSSLVAAPSANRARPNDPFWPGLLLFLRRPPFLPFCRLICPFSNSTFHFFSCPAPSSARFLVAEPSSHLRHRFFSQSSPSPRSKAACSGPHAVIFPPAVRSFTIARRPFHFFPPRSQPAGSLTFQLVGRHLALSIPPNSGMSTEL